MYQTDNTSDILPKHFSSERNYSLDFIRIFACFLVILYHVPQYVQGGLVFHDVVSRALNSAFFYLGRCAVPLFFITSGYLLLPLKTDVSYYFKRRVTRIVIPTLFWFILYQFLGKAYDNPVHSIWIDRTPHFWYLYALFGIYLLLPIITPWYKNSSRKLKIFYLLLWCITLFFVINDQKPLSYELTHQGMLYSTPFHSLLIFSGYFGYFYLGALIRDYYETISVYFMKVFWGGVLLYFVLLFAIRVLFQPADTNLIAYCSLPTAVLSSLLFLLFLKLGNLLGRRHQIKKFYSLTKNLSGATFSMYLMHPLFLGLIPIDNIGGYSRLLIALIVFVVTFIVYKIISLIPQSKYILG